MINKFKIKNLRLKIQIFRKGFTLVEVLIYAGIVTMIITFALLGTYQIIDYQDRLEDQLEVTENSKFLIQKIAWVLQNNSAINSPVLGSSGLSLSVNKLNYGSNPLVITLSNGRAWLST
ncbi:MAG: prepilin-type N-terminal cleavage/methylation domain-containing protein, partial [Patescibacteria group bacterium]